MYSIRDWTVARNLIASFTSLEAFCNADIFCARVKVPLSRDTPELIGSRGTIKERITRDVDRKGSQVLK